MSTPSNFHCLPWDYMGHATTFLAWTYQVISMLFIFAPYTPFSTDTRVVLLTHIMLLFCLKPSRGCPHSLRVESKVLEWPVMPWRSSSIPAQTSSPFSLCWLPELWPQGLLVLGGTVPPMSQVQACGSMCAVPSAWSIPPHSAHLRLLLQAYAEMSPYQMTFLTTLVKGLLASIYHPHPVLFFFSALTTITYTCFVSVCFLMARM